MKRLLLLLCLLPPAGGCTDYSSAHVEGSSANVAAAEPTMKDDATACAYWKCSTEKKLYMQKYVKQEGEKYVPAGSFKLEGGGVGAFPLADLEKQGSDGAKVSVNDGFDPCPYCKSTSLGNCPCSKTHCMPTGGGNRVTCPWCGQTNTYGGSGGWGVGGGG
ncbi:MAG: TerY-C metal binding domain-containing protein [Thermoguttaceae bacterium]